MRLRGPIIVLALLLLVGVVCAQDAAEQAGSDVDQARTKIQADYADSLNGLARMTDAERLALAEALLAAARDTERPEVERFVLADLAAEAAAPVGTQAGSDLAGQGMILAQELGFYTPVDRTKRQREMAMGRLATMQANRVDPAAIEPVAREVIRATLSHCDALIAAEPGAATRY